MRWLAVLVAVGLVAVSCGDSDSDNDSDNGADGDEATESSRFVGLISGEAVALAESEGRMWRIGRTGEEFFAMDASLVEGRVTFEVDDAMVTAASIETETGPEGTVPDEGVVDDPSLAGLEADAVQRLVTIDNNFETDETNSLPFDTVIVSSLIGGDADHPLEPLARELIAAAIQADATVKFTQNPDAEIADLAASQTSGVAVVEIEDIRIDGNQAEIDLGLWCGTLCGVYLTYETELVAEAWTINGTVGPIAVS